MKKTLVVMLALVLALAMCTMSLAAVATPFDDENLKVNVAVKMDEGDVSSLFVGTANASDSLGLKSPWIDTYEGVVYLNATSRGAAWLGFVTDKLADVTKAEGFGFYVQNNTGNDLPLSIVLSTDASANLNNGSYAIGSNKEYALVDMDGNKTVKTAPEKTHPYAPETIVHSDITIPAEFEGHVFIPLASLQQVWGGPDTSLPSDAKITGFGWMPSDSDGHAYDNGDLGIDNIFYYGANVEEADSELVLGEEAGPKPTNPAEPGTTEKPTEPGGNTGDVQLWVEIAVAAAAIIAVAAVAVFKKKKSQE